MKRFLLNSLVATALVLGATTARPCTTCVLQGGGKVYLARNLDWEWEHGLVLVNPRHLRKTALVMPPKVPAQWTSKYGSVTFNQFGRELPFGGMNEAGLVVENMMLDESKYPPTDDRPEVNMLQWIQYQLDNCRTVAEVLATDDKVRMEELNLPAHIHYLVCDAQGDCATIEFIDGKRVVHRGKDLPYQALANDTYSSSLAHTQAKPLPEKTPAKAKDMQSLNRFAHAAIRSARYKSGTAKENLSYAFDTLDQVCQGKFTVWRIVYDVTGRQIHYRTVSDSKDRVLDLKKMDFACTKPIQYADIRTAAADNGKVQFKELTDADHRKYLEGFLGQDSLKKDFGDLTPIMEGLLLVLRTYTCMDK